MAVEFNLIHPQFQSQHVAVVKAGAFRGYAVELNGAVLTKVNGHYVVLDDEGRAVPVWVKRTLFDPVPRLKMGGQIVWLARPLTWYEYVWLGFPMAILLLGGPGLLVVGYPAVVLNSQILRSNRGAFARYVLTGLVSVGTVGLVLLAAMALGLILDGIP